MRLSAKQKDAIKEIFFVHFLPKDHIWLFGSRVDDFKKGGDIDLYIETNYEDPAIVVEKKIGFLSNLKAKIGDQKIDVIINLLKKNKHLRIYDEAKNTGIKIL